MLNRMEEYNELLKELEVVDESTGTEESTECIIDKRLEGILDRAIERRKRKNLVLRPLI